MMSCHATSFLSIVLLLLASQPSIVQAAPVQERQTTIPSYVTEYAPILYLDSAELYFPSDLGQQLVHTKPEVNNVVVAGAPSPLTLNNLADLNALGGTNVYLTSNEGIEALPAWFTGVKPGSTGIVSGAVTCAVVTVEKDDIAPGTVDVFYLYFYAYNQGNNVDILGKINLGEFGDHVGDWEHTMIRFLNGVPQSVWLSQHSSGEAFTYSAMAKSGVRPIVYVAKGTHANYATSGTHDHTLSSLFPGIPNIPADLLLTDATSAGFLYDPVQSSYFISYDNSTNVFTPYTATTPTNWITFEGQWGDAQLANGAPGQIILFGQAKYSGGPNGPIFKGLGRTTVCLGVDDCIISPIVTS